MFQQIRSSLQRPLHGLLLKTISKNPWTRFQCDVPLQHFGKGAPNCITPYLQGNSNVTVHTITEIRDWISNCTYSKDIELFGQSDYWQHPLEFERRRRGDCEDFSLWVWRKLIKLGYRAEFVAGWSGGNPSDYRPHTWVHYHDTEASYLFDPVLCCPQRMIQPLGSMATSYLPEFALDQELKRYVYAGYYNRIHTEWRASYHPKLENDISPE